MAKAIVIDNGSDMCLAGFAGDMAPKAVFPSVVGFSEEGSKKVYAGDEAVIVAKRGKIDIKYPIEYGVVTNWEAMEKLWHHTFYEQLRVSPDAQPVILSEVPLNPKAVRERMTEIMFEKFKVPGLFINSQAVHALYTNGKKAGVVIDCGHGATHISPVFDGYLIPHTVIVLDIAGIALTEYLRKIFVEKGFDLDTEVVRDIKERYCFVSQDFEADLIKYSETDKHNDTHRLPNYQELTLGNEKFRCAEALFSPAFIGSEAIGIGRCAFDAVMKNNVDIRLELYKNYLLTGGSALIPGLARRIEREVDALSADVAKVKVIKSPTAKYDVWMGAAIDGSRPVFNSNMITKSDYEKHGPPIVNMKCPQGKE